MRLGTLNFELMLEQIETFFLAVGKDWIYCACKKDMNLGDPRLECYVLNVSVTKIRVDPNPHEMVLAGGAFGK